MRADRQQAVLALLDLVDLDLDGVRDLVVGAVQDLFADDLGQPHLQRQVGVLARRIEQRALRHQLDECVDDLPHPCSGLRADREDLTGNVQVGGLLQALDGRGPAQQVDLVQNRHREHARFADRVRDEAVARSYLLVPVQHEQRYVGLAQLGLHAPLHAFGQRVPRALHAGQVDDHELPVVGRRHAADRAPRRLGARRDDRDLASHDRVQQRRLAGIGPPGERDETGARRHSEAMIRSWSSSIRPSSVSWSYPHRWRTPCTTASIRSSVCSGQITTSPSSRGPGTAFASSIGKDSTSVGASRPR